MTKYFYLLFFLIACNSKNKQLVYQDSSDKFYVTIEKVTKNGKTDSLLTFHDFDNPSQIKEAGFYKAGFRNDVWSYNLPTEVKTIKWAYHKDKNLNFETNVFDYADSAKYGDFFTKLLFTTEIGKIVLTVSVNGPFKDSLPENNYARITKNEFYKTGITPISFNTRKIANKPNDIYLNEITAKIDATNEKRYMKSAFSFVDKNHFIEFGVSSGTKNNIYADILFNAVLTNFNIDGKWLYDPFNNQNRTQ